MKSAAGKHLPLSGTVLCTMMVASCHAFGNIGKGIGNAIGGQLHKEIDTSIDATRTGFDATKDVVTTGGISENTRHEFGNTLHDADPTGMDILHAGHDLVTDGQLSSSTRNQFGGFGQDMGNGGGGGGGGDDSCQYAFDGECDEPEFCSHPTDCTDCRSCGGH